MTSQKLIDQLVNDLVPAAPHHPYRAIGLAVAIGAALTLGLVGLVYGVQPGLDTVRRGAPLAMKSAYAVAVAAIASPLLLALARPGTTLPRGWRWLAVPAAGLGALAIAELLRLPVDSWPRTWPRAMLGNSWQQCPWRIAALSLPVFAGLCVAIRRQAPTELRAAGAAAGLLAGAVAAAAYALACTEGSAAFVLIWYSSGLALASAMGAALGPRLLHW